MPVHKTGLGPWQDLGGAEKKQNNDRIMTSKQQASRVLIVDTAGEPR